MWNQACDIADNEQRARLSVEDGLRIDPCVGTGNHGRGGLLTSPRELGIALRLGGPHPRSETVIACDQRVVWTDRHDAAGRRRIMRLSRRQRAP